MFCSFVNMKDVDNKEFLEKLVNQGLTQKEIDEQLGVSKTTVKRRLKKFGLKTVFSQKFGESFEVDCGFCGEKMLKTKYYLTRTKSGLVFCSKSCSTSYNNTLCSKKDLLNRTLLEYKEKHTKNKRYKASIYRAIRDMARNWFKDLTKKPCENCGYDKHVELCHIKAISEFPLDSTISEINSKDNIIQLCRNCHWELDNGHLKIENIKT